MPHRAGILMRPSQLISVFSGRTPASVRQNRRGAMWARLAVGVLLGLTVVVFALPRSSAGNEAVRPAPSPPPTIDALLALGGSCEDHRKCTALLREADVAADVRTAAHRHDWRVLAVKLVFPVALGVADADRPFVKPVIVDVGDEGGCAPPPSPSTEERFAAYAAHEDCFKLLHEYAEQYNAGVVRAAQQERARRRTTR
jgi:hypothetical protein